MLDPDFARLEEAFKYAVGNLPNYKRGDAFAYVNALKRKIEALGKEIDELSNHIVAKGSLNEVQGINPGENNG